MKVKISFPYNDWPILRQFPGGKPILEDFEFYINSKLNIEFDYWIVFNFPLGQMEEAICRKGGLILITGEPETIDNYSREYVNQFDHIITSQKKIKHKSKHYYPQGLPWFVEKSYDELKMIKEIKKTKNISIISSTKNFTNGHRVRLDFVKKMKNYFKEEIDLYGRGLNGFERKWDVLAPYKYSIAIENTSCNYYFTEKLTDCFLAQTYPIYYGCSNIEDYFNKESLQKINIGDPGGSIKIIETLLNDADHYERKIPVLKIEKDKVLDEYNLFSIVRKFVNSNLRNDINNKYYAREVYTMNPKIHLAQKIANFLWK